MPEESLQPEYVKNFRCIGSQCEQTCCAGWGIYVDKATYKKYRAQPSLRQAAKDLIEINPAARDNFEFAMVRMQGNRCAFLTPENLCKIQQRHGEEYLSKTCQRYPRALTRMAGKIQKALLLSCPEAARMVVLGSELLPSEKPLYSWAFASESSHRAETSSNEMMRSLRAMALDVLRDRSYALWQRLFLVGNLCRRVREPFNRQSRGMVQELCSQYATIISEGQLRSSLNGIPWRPAPQVELVQGLLQRRFQLGQPENGFSSRVAHFLQIIHAESGALQPDSVQRYSDACEQRGAAFEQAFPLFMENYLLNYVIQTGFPALHGGGGVGERTDPLVSFVVLMLHYRLLQSLMIGEAAWHGAAFSAAHAVQMVYTFARGLEHNLAFSDELRRTGQRPELQTSDGMAMVLRN